MRAIIDAMYHGRRHKAMNALAGRIVREGAAAPGWTRKRIADALVVLSSIEPFHALVERRQRSAASAADLLYDLAGAFLID